MSDRLVFDNKVLSGIVHCVAIWLYADRHTITRRDAEVKIKFFHEGADIIHVDVDIYEFDGLTFRECAQLLFDKAK